jgi:hypothetical protein
MNEHVEVSPVTKERICTKESHKNYSVMRSLSMILSAFGFMLTSLVIFPPEAVTVGRVLPGLLIFVVGSGVYLALGRFDR